MNLAYLSICARASSKKFIDMQFLEQIQKLSKLLSELFFSVSKKTAGGEHMASQGASLKALTDP